jgi:uncharacterized protein (TIGR00251 family)
MALIFIIKVVPNAGRHGWQLDKSGLLKCYLKSLPEKGKANQELIKLLAKALKIELNQIEITAGSTSRNKRLRIETNLNYAQFLEQLGICEQKTIFG